MSKKAQQLDLVDAIERPFIRGPYNYDRDKASRDTGVVCGESLTHQSFKDECDINTIVKRFGITGTVPQGVRVPEYKDFDEIVDYKTAMDAVLETERHFMTLPAAVRARFGNDPQELLEFMSQRTPAHIEEAQRLGLIPKPEAAQVVDKPKE